MEGFFTLCQGTYKVLYTSEAFTFERMTNGFEPRPQPATWNDLYTKAISTISCINLLENIYVKWSRKLSDFQKVICTHRMSTGL